MRPRARTKFVLALSAAAIVGGLVVARTRSLAQTTTPAPTSAGVGSVGDVPFDHTIHAGKYGIPCLDCHSYADKSPVAGLPSGRKCMGCHKFVDKENPAVQTLASHVEAGEPLRWERVFAVPDFVYFSHRMHVRANVACTECHGDVAGMKTVVQQRPFTMGRCMGCHHERNATHDCLGCHK
jgi:hypothetical protein